MLSQQPKIHFLKNACSVRKYVQHENFGYDYFGYKSILLMPETGLKSSQNASSQLSMRTPLL